MNSRQLEALFDRLFPINRSITGNGLRKSLAIIGEYIPLNIIEYKSGTKCFDWVVPEEWNISEAYIEDQNGKRIVDFKENNLHVMGYSIPVFGIFTMDDLLPHLFTIPEKPDAIPFVTSYYKRNWGFCLSHNTLLKMKDSSYRVCIESELSEGSLTLGELLIKGKSKKEVLLFSHIGHPSMANDQLSGPLTLVGLASRLLNKKEKLKYSYRFVLTPETIGSIAYIARNKSRLRKRVMGGMTAACTADHGGFTYRTPKSGNTPFDTAVETALKQSGEIFEIHGFSPLGCDERHFNSHGIGIAIGSLMRTPPGQYPEYHTSLDNKDFISFDKLTASVDLLESAISNFESDCIIQAIHKNCEPKLDKHGLYPTTSNKNDKNQETGRLVSIWALADGRLLSEISTGLGISTVEARKLADKLAAHKLIRIRETL